MTLRPSALAWRSSSTRRPWISEITKSRYPIPRGPVLLREEDVPVETSQNLQQSGVGLEVQTQFGPHRGVILRHALLPPGRTCGRWQQ